MWSGDPWVAYIPTFAVVSFVYLRGSYAEVDGLMSTGSTGRSPTSSISAGGGLLIAGLTMRGAGKNIDCCEVTTALAKATFQININYLDRLKAQSRHVSVSSHDVALRRINTMASPSRHRRNRKGPPFTELPNFHTFP